MLIPAALTAFVSIPACSPANRGRFRFGKAVSDTFRIMSQIQNQLHQVSLATTNEDAKSIDLVTKAGLPPTQLLFCGCPANLSRIDIAKFYAKTRRFWQKHGVLETLQASHFMSILHSAL